MPVSPALRHMGPRVTFRHKGGTYLAGGIAEHLRHVTTRNTACVPAGYIHLPNAYTVPYGTRLTCLSRSALAMVPGLTAYCINASGISYGWGTVSSLPALSGRSTPCSTVYCAVWRCSGKCAVARYGHPDLRGNLGTHQVTGPASSGQPRLPIRASEFPD